VQTHQIQIIDGRSRVDEIRSELFAFSEVLDVLITWRPDALVVVCTGHPHPAEWQRALRAVGFSLPSRRRDPVPVRREGFGPEAVLSSRATTPRRSSPRAPISPYAKATP
jgi:hypothetical protein